MKLFRSTTEDVHTNVIAGLALDDGHTIAAWLPEAEAEMPGPAFLTRRERRIRRTPPPACAPGSRRARSTAIRGGDGCAGFFNWQAGCCQPADLKVITRDGKRHRCDVMSDSDGVTGLSVITLAKTTACRTWRFKDETIQVGQRASGDWTSSVRRDPETAARDATYVRIGETEATSWSGESHVVGRNGVA